MYLASCIKGHLKAFKNKGDSRTTRGQKKEFLLGIIGCRWCTKLVFCIWFHKEGYGGQWDQCGEFPNAKAFWDQEGGSFGT